MMKSKMMAGGGMMKKSYASGGMPMGPDGKPTFVGDGKGKMAKGGMAKAKMGPSKMGKVATGKPAMGSASKRADGVAVKGKTKGKVLAGGGMAKSKMMASGGKAKMMKSGGAY
jgi:hypothetical protein